MTEKQGLKIPEWLTAGVAFVYYWIMALYKLTTAPIWQDEAMEYYCSIPVKGAIRGVTEYTSMYERMAYIQQQPPLYNWLMCIWLQIHDSEWWYRFSSVVMGFIAVIGLYVVIKKLCNRFTATLSVFVFSSIYILMYYVKEASEYMLLIMLLIWTVYLYLCILEKPTCKGIIGFTVLCVANIYSHYGAVFVIVPMALQILYQSFKNRNVKAIRTTLAAYLIAVIGAGIPLVVFYILPQSTNPNSTIGMSKTIEFTGNNILTDFFDSMMWVLRWCMLDYDRDWEKLTWAIWILLFALLVVAIVCYIKTKKKSLQSLIRCNIGIYLLYYILTKLNFYAYGWYGNRYNLFILPIWFITITAILYEMLQLMKQSDKAVFKKLMPYMAVMILTGSVLFSCYGVKRIHDHWDKSDLRTVATVWYDEGGYEIPTFVNYHLRYAFIYYFTHETDYEESKWQYLYTCQNLDTMSFNNEQWIEYLENTVYPEGLPQKLYVVSGQKDTVVNALESVGYKVEPVVDTTAKLFLLTAPE